MTETRWARSFDRRIPGTGYTVREFITGRDTPPGTGRPRCAWCGAWITGPPDVHHLLYRGQLGDGRPSNGISLCPPGAGGCHAVLHDREPAQAQARGFQRHGGWPVPECYAAPLRCFWRGWIVLDDAGGWRPAGRAEVEDWHGEGAWAA